jgi:hypothetical protein
MEVSVLPLESRRWLGGIWRTCAAALFMVLLLTACGPRSAGPASADRPSAGPATTCHPDEAMGRPCPSEGEGASGTQQSADDESKEYGLVGEDGDTYGGKVYEECDAFLRQSFTAFKACARY